MKKTITFAFLLVTLLISNLLYPKEPETTSAKFNLSANMGRFFPLYSHDLNYQIGGQNFDSKIDIEDDLSFGINLGFIIREKFFIETGGDFFFGEETFSGDLIHSDFSGGIDTKRDFRKSLAYLNLGICPISWGKFSPYLSIGPTWVFAKVDDGNINAEFYPKNQNLDKIKYANLTVEAAKLQKKIDEQKISGENDNSLGFNTALGLHYLFEKSFFLDLGLRYTNDNVKLWGSESFKTGGFNIFLGAGFSITPK